MHTLASVIFIIFVVFALQHSKTSGTFVFNEVESSCGSASVAYSTEIAALYAGKHLTTFESCCAAHDKCYDDCTSRVQCDQEFGACMKHSCAFNNQASTTDANECDDQAVVLYEECVATSEVFFTVVEALGSLAYSVNCSADSGESPGLFHTEFSSSDLLSFSSQDIMIT
jgi:hypothetical protein